MNLSMKPNRRTLPIAFLALGGCLVLAGCGSEETTTDRGFHTSGSREADQRAEQRIVREEQISGEDRDEGEQVEGNGNDEDSTLYARLGAGSGIAKIVDDFVDRAMADPRVNWRRKGVTTGGFLRIRKRSAEWHPTAAEVERLKKHMAQFLSVATGGPAEYEGRDMEAAHRDMKITNAEFDASVGDMKATLDALSIPTPEQKELLAILESTRPQIVEER